MAVPNIADARAAVTANNERLIVVVTTRDPDTDTNAASEFLARGNVVVFAPFPPPPRQSHDEESLLDGGERWHVLPCEFVADWRLRFLAWTQARVLGDTMLDAQALDTWMARIDGSGDLFATPGSLLSLCAVAHDLGEARLRAKSATELLDEALERLVRSRAGARNEPDARWLECRGVAAFKKLAESRFLDPCVPVTSDRGLSRASWTSVVPQDLTSPALTIDEQAHELAAFAARGPASGETEARDLLQRWAGVSADDVVRILEAEGFLRGLADGGLDLHPAWLQRLTWTLGIQAALAGPPSVWGRWCLEPGRRQIVKSLLRQLQPEALLAVIRRVVDAEGPADPATCCALEVTFEAVARHLRGKPGKGNERLFESIQALWRRQLAQCVEREPGLPSPLFGRPDPADGHEGWIADCWALSLSVPRPEDAPEGLDWLLPGWGRPALDAVPPWLTRVRLPWRDGRGQAGSERLARLALRVVERTVPGDGRLPVPPILRVATWFGSDDMEWHPGFSMIEALAEDPAAASTLAHSLQRTVPSERTRVLHRLWTALRGAAPGSSRRAFEDSFEPIPRVDLLRSADPGLYDLLVEHLTDANIEEALDSLTTDKARALHAFDALARNVAALPPRLRRAALKHLLVLGLSAEVSDALCKAVLDACASTAPSRHDLDALALVATRRGREGEAARHAREAATRRWSAAASPTLEHTLQAWPALEADVWWETAPAEVITALFERIEATPRDLWPAWTHAWLVSHFPPSLELVDRMFAALARSR
jgi:hypothetical protein